MWRQCVAIIVVLSAAVLSHSASSPIAAPLTEQDETAPVPPSESAASIAVPDGFNVTLFAGEPDVRQPIAFTTDDRGRLWVVECYSYPNWMPGAVRGKDRVVIFDDMDGDGRFDDRKVFWEKGDNLTGIELGFGGVWLCATPNLIFVPDRDGDDRPDGEPEIVLDGWDPNCRHNAFNALNWGPDGWLYGCNGILSNSKIGRPGTPDAERVAMNCGVWRYHPTRRVFEAVAHGTTNPWGLDFDDYGEMFITNCVIPHLFHVVPGAHFQRMFGQDINPHSYDLMKSCADHIHWGGGDWTSSRGGQGIHDSPGGGHAHAGAMIYLGDNWPARYRNSVFTCNIHGRRLNNDRLTRSGSGYVATHDKDFLFSSDEWYRGLEMRFGPDGGVFLTDWSDTGECHDYDSAHGVHRESGRIFKITHGVPRPARVDLAKLSDAELVELQSHQNDWYVRHARRLLHERAADGRDTTAINARLWKQFASQTEVPRKLRALWALRVTGGLDDASLARLLDHESNAVRVWAVRLISELKQPLANGAGQNVFGKFVSMATADPSPRVRLELASALQRIPTAQRWPIASALLTHNGDSGDANIPLMLWYGIEPLVPADYATAAALAGRSQIPLVGRFLARRIVLESERTAGAAGPAQGLAALVQVLGHTDDNTTRLNLLTGMNDALRGRKTVPMPRGWPELAAKLTAESELREPVLVLAMILGDPKAAAELRATMLDRTQRVDRRQLAMQILAERSTSGLAPQLQQLLDDPTVRGGAIRALAAYNDPATPKLLVSRYQAFSEAERADAISTLATRPGYALALLSAIESKSIPARDLSPFTARQIQAFGNKELSDKLAAVWGTVRPAGADKKSQIAKYKSSLTPAALQVADVANGRLVFNRTCAACHKLNGDGADVGPDLTGSNRDNLDFVLENVLDPSAIVGRDYKLTIVATKDGRVMSGVVRERIERALVLQTANERLTLSLDDIEEMKESPVSMMPEGIFDKMTIEEVRDLVGYLGRTSRVPRPGE
jgi:putative membrane-bound dehydrogenase-like protein